MKYITFSFGAFLLACLFMVGCNPEYTEDDFDLSNGVSAGYVDMAVPSIAIAVDTTLANGEIVVATSDTTTAALSTVDATVVLEPRVRTARTSDTEVTIELVGDYSTTVSGVIPAGALSADVPVTLPYGPNALNGMTVATITSVGGGLTIGRAGDLDRIATPITWTSN